MLRTIGPKMNEIMGKSKQLCPKFILFLTYYDNDQMKYEMAAHEGDEKFIQTFYWRA